MENEKLFIENNSDRIIPNDLRTRCEVWSRPVGYLRPVYLYNKGKLREYKERKNFEAKSG